MDEISRIIENHIKKAMENGTFDQLPGKGKAQQLTDLRFIPAEQRAAFLALRNSFGSLPPEIALRKDIAALEEKLQTAREEDKPGIMKAIAEKKMSYDIVMERHKR